MSEIEREAEVSFRGIGIPTEVLFNPFLSSTEKMLFGLIRNLAHSKRGCWASNRYLAGILGKKKQTISNSVGNLKKYLYITINMYTKNNVQIREIHINNEYSSIYKEAMHLLYDKNGRFQQVDDTILRSIYDCIKKTIQGYKELNSKDVLLNSNLNSNFSSFHEEEISPCRTETPTSDNSHYKQEPVIKLNRRNNPDKLPKQIKFINEDEAEIFDYWNSLSKPFKQHRNNNKTSTKIYAELQKLLLSYEKEDIMSSIKNYHSLLQDENTIFTKPCISYYSINEFLFFITPQKNQYYKWTEFKKVIKEKTGACIKGTLFEECLINKSPEIKFKYEERKVIDKYPNISKRFKLLWANKVLHKKTIDNIKFTAREEDNFAKASINLVQLMKTNKYQNPTNAALTMVKDVYTVLSKEHNDNLNATTVHTGFIAQDWWYNKNVQSYFLDQGVINSFKMLEPKKKRKTNKDDYDIKQYRKGMEESFVPGLD